MVKEVINVGLYGGKSIFGGKETPLEASVVSCDKHNSCSYFKNGQCLAVRSVLNTGCKFGSVNNIKGYTSRAKKYGEFKREWQGHEKYNKLQHPPTKLGLIDDTVVFPYPFVRIENGVVKDPLIFSNDKSYIKLEEFTVELIHRICTYRPQAMMGGEITAYQKEKVPLFLSHLEEIFPDLYHEFTSKYDGFTQKISYVGRKALLKTLKPTDIQYKASTSYNLNSDWYWDGEYLNYKNGYVSSVSVIKDYEIDTFRLKPSDKTVVTITSDNQVSKETIFID